MGIVLRKLEKLDKALVASRKAVELKPGDALGYYQLGNVLRNLKHMDEAAAAYGKASELKSSGAYEHNFLGNAALNHMVAWARTGTSRVMPTAWAVCRSTSRSTTRWAGGQRIMEAMPHDRMSDMFRARHPDRTMAPEPAADIRRRMDQPLPRSASRRRQLAG